MSDLSQSVGTNDSRVFTRVPPGADPGTELPLDFETWEKQLLDLGYVHRQPHETGTEPVHLGRFPQPAAPGSVRLALLADTHVAGRSRGKWKVYHRTEKRLRQTVEDVNQRGVDALVLAGDLTKDGERSNFELFEEIVRELDAPRLIVPGNHDVPKDHNDHPVEPITGFEGRYTDGGYPQVVRVGKWSLVGLNTTTLPDGSLSDSDGGGLDRAQQDWLKRHLRELPNPVLVAHHLLEGPARFNFRLTEGFPWEEQWIQNRGRLHRLVSGQRPLLHLAGHLHVPYLNTLGSVREIAAPAVSSFPPSYMLVDLHAGGVDVSLVPLATREELREAYDHAADDSPYTRNILRLNHSALVEQLSRRKKRERSAGGRSHHAPSLP